MPARRLARLALPLLALGLVGCRTATTLRRDRDLYAEAARTPEAPAPPVLVTGFCDADATEHLRRTLATRAGTAEAPDLVVAGGAHFQGTRSVGTGEAIAIYTYDFIMAFPGLVLPVPMIFAAEYRIGFSFADRETGFLRARRELEFLHRGTTYWVWGLMGVRACRPADFEPLAVALIEEESRRLSRPDERRAFLASARERFEGDRLLLQALQRGKDPSGGPPGPVESELVRKFVADIDPTGPASVTPARADAGDRLSVRGSGRVSSAFKGSLDVKDRATLDPATGKVVRTSAGSGQGAIHWSRSRSGPASDGGSDRAGPAAGADPLAAFEYVWDHPARRWRLVRSAADAATLTRALAENEAALARIEARARALGP